MHTVRCSSCLSCQHVPPPCIPPAMHAPPTMHTSLSCKCVPCHACPLPCYTSLSCMPPAMHAPCHSCPLPCNLLPCIPPPLLNRMTDTCKNITFPQLLLPTVIIRLMSKAKTKYQPIASPTWNPQEA